ncbi:hypothetical protein BCR43DRAFT_507334 [Syncephalastrum racemosum]|uniref:Uncharacterized protein n=1 Tax=Syncephalastrum racemosum TaxID=13706 RepID=A0A1X2H6N8_SYNRA|nr:hypothetical protein BCR43DRAFT_507334 [Syncephalastrum racemosum]
MHYLHMLSLVAAVGGMATSAAPYGYTPDQAVHSSVAGMLVMVNDVPQQPKNKSFRPIVVAPIVEANAHGKGNKWAPLAVPSASASASIPASASASASRSAAPHASVSASATPSSHAMDHIRDVYGVDMDGLVQTVHLPMTASAFGHGHGLTPRATNSAHADIADTPTGRSLDDAFPDLEDAVEHQPNLNPPHKRACADTEDFDANMLVKLPDGRAVPSCRHVKSGM